MLVGVKYITLVNYGNGQMTLIVGHDEPDKDDQAGVDFKLPEVGKDVTFTFSPDLIIS